MQSMMESLQKSIILNKQKPVLTPTQYNETRTTFFIGDGVGEEELDGTKHTNMN